MDGALAIAASGLGANAAWLDRIASRVVQATTPPPASAGNSSGTTVGSATVTMPSADLASALVDQRLALLNFRANAAVFRTAEEMDKTLFSLVV